MVTGTLKSQVDKVWDAFWSGGIANPLQVIEQITYLLFLRRLDELQTLAEAKAAATKQPVERAIFPEGQDERGRDYRGLALVADFGISSPTRCTRSWATMSSRSCAHLVVKARNYAQHMKDATFTIPTPGLLAKVVDLIAEIPMADRDTKGDVYEYMLSKIATCWAERSVPHSTPHHPAHGRDDCAHTDGRHLRSRVRHRRLPDRCRRVPARAPPEDAAGREAALALPPEMFHGFDFDSTMLRIGSMNMLLHGVENPDIRIPRLSGARTTPVRMIGTRLVLANPPFAGSLDYETTCEGSAGRRQDQEDRTALPRPVPPTAEARRPRRGHRPRRRVVRVEQRTQGAAQDSR